MLEGTINDRAGGDLHVNTSNMEERKGDILDVSKLSLIIEARQK